MQWSRFKCLERGPDVFLLVHCYYWASVTASSLMITQVISSKSSACLTCLLLSVSLPPRPGKQVSGTLSGELSGDCGNRLFQQSAIVAHVFAVHGLLIE